MASTRVQIRLCRGAGTPSVVWTGQPFGSAAAAGAGHRRCRGRSALPRPPLPSVLIVSLGRAKLLVLLRSGASDGLPSFFKGVERDEVGCVCVGLIPSLGDVASQRLLLSWVSWVVLLQEHLELLEAYLPSHLAVKPMYPATWRHRQYLT